MKRYSVQTGWTEYTDNLHPGKVRRFPESKGNIEILAINEAVARECILVDYVFLATILKEVKADDTVSNKMGIKIPTNLMCGSKLLIAN